MEGSYRAEIAAVAAAFLSERLPKVIFTLIGPVRTRDQFGP